MSNIRLAQEVVVVLAPFPNNPNPVAEFDVVRDFDLNGDGLVWYARPQLFFNCTLCSRGCQGPEYSADHKEVSLVYFSTFEPINLTPNSVMQKAGVPMLYDTASNPRLPSLNICPAANVLGRAPLIPCFIDSDGNTHPTIPYKFKNSRNLGSASADTQPDRGNGSRLYEVNLWLWRYGRGQPRTMSIDEAEAARQNRISEARRRAEETKKRRREAAGRERAAAAE